MDTDSRAAGGYAPRSSASLAEIKFIIKTSIMPPTPPSSVCQSTKRIQKFLQNGGESSFEQSMEFKPINALSSARFGCRERFSERFVNKSTGNDDEPIVISGDNDALSNWEDNEDLDLNLNDGSAGRLTHTLKKPKLGEEHTAQPTFPLVKSTSVTDLPAKRSSFYRTCSLSFSPALSSSASRSGSEFVQEKLVVPTVLITSTPTKDSPNDSLEDIVEAVPMNRLLPNPLSKDDMQMFDSDCEMRDAKCEEDMEFSFICEPAECWDPFNETIETPIASSCQSQLTMEPVFLYPEPLCMNSVEMDQQNNNGNGNNKENELLVPHKKCLNSNRFSKSATVRVLHSLAVSGY